MRWKEESESVVRLASRGSMSHNKRVPNEDKMVYKTKLAGIVHALDPIRNADAYARATFSDLSVVRYRAEGKRLYFTVVGTITGDMTLSELTDGLIVGNDTNVTWDIFTTHKVRETALAIAA